MKLFILLLLLCLGIPSFSQVTDSRGWYQTKDIENIEIGWIKRVQFTAPAKSFTQHGRTYTAAQIDMAQKMAVWLQQTYSPKGLLGEMKISVYALPASEPVTSSSYNYNEAEKNNRNALPGTYGALARLYMNLRKTDTKKFWPIDGLANYYVWQIMANNIELISRQLIGLSTPDEYYCIMPKYSIGMKGKYGGAESDKKASEQNFTGSPNLKNYEHYWIPGDALNNNESFYTVVMTRDRQALPFEQVTVSQLINRLEKQLPLMYKIDRNSGGRMNDVQEKAKKGLGIMKEKFRDQYNEYVYLNSSSDINIVDLANIDANSNFYWMQTKPEVQDKYGNTTVGFPLLRLKKGIKEACAAAGPQWVVFKLFKGAHSDDAGAMHLLENFVSRFNYDYLYDYCFGKEQPVKPYQPK